MKTDWFKVAAIFLVAGIFIGFFIFIVFPEAYAMTPTAVREVYLSDHTRCVVVEGADRGYGRGVGVTCDWERRYACDSQRLKP